MIAKQTLDALGWEFDAAKSRDEQVKGSLTKRLNQFIMNKI